MNADLMCRVHAETKRHVRALSVNCLCFFEKLQEERHSLCGATAALQQIRQCHQRCPGASFLKNSPSDGALETVHS